ncbi:hypothetical protein GCM10023090_21210 [Acidovorax lacteus]|uniref:Metallo-beta-lactamase-like C-terminal domain-containing protein n=1 Tax=Acidovorax lacteus TaxID=1924988 RepID=A0ABP8LCN4_9BURK
MGLFLKSLKRYERLPGESLVLPSHGRPFQGLHTRLHALQAHHADRLNALCQALQGTSATAAEVLPVLFNRPLDAHQTTFALGEAIAHLHRLWKEGAVTRHTDAQGVHRFGG